jgi:phage gp16-like protein
MTASDPRRALYAAVHAAAAKAGLDDAAYRDMLEAQTGRRSAKDCGAAQLRAVLDHLNGEVRTFRPSPRAEVRMIHALWADLKRRGALKTASKAALRTFCARQVGLKGQAATDPEFLNTRQCRAVIEALKAWIGRLSAPPREQDHG